MFTGVYLSTGEGGLLSQHALQVVSQHALQHVSSGGSLGQHPRGKLRGSGLGGGVPSPHRGCLFWGVPALGGSAWPRGVPGQGGCLLQGAPAWGGPGGDPPDGHCCGRCASYWNAFFFSRLAFKTILKFLDPVFSQCSNSYESLLTK